MGKVIIDNETTKNPITLMGKMAGECWGADTKDNSKNYKRGLQCLKDNHGRVMEYPTVCFKLEGYSARVIREFYTHIGGAPTRLQSSTRYIDYKDFKFVIPPSIHADKKARKIYYDTILNLKESLKELDELGMPREDIGMLLPLGMETSIVCKFNPRTLMDMSRQRKCNRAYWEFRWLFSDLEKALKEYSKEWEYIVDNCFKSKCDVLGYCPESKSCGKYE